MSWDALLAKASVHVMRRPPADDYDERHLQDNGDGDSSWPSKHPLLPKLSLSLGSPSQSPPLSLAVSLTSGYVTLPCGGSDEQSQYDLSKSTTSLVPGCSFCSSKDSGDANDANEAQCSSARDRCEVSTYLLMNRNYWAGFLSTDEASVPAASASSSFVSSYRVKDPPLTVACQTASTGLAAQISGAGIAVDGVAGMAPTKYSLLGQLWTNNLLRDREFTLCVNRMLDHSSGEAVKYQPGMERGKITIGGYTPPGGSTAQSVPNDVKKAALLRSASRPGYYVNVKNIYLTTPSSKSSTSSNDQDSTVKVAIDPIRFSDANSVDGGVLIDPASPYTLLSSQIEADFTAKWRSLTGTSFGYGQVELTSWELLSFPTILLEMEGAAADTHDENSQMSIVYAIPPTNYMEYIPSTGRHRMRLSLKSTEGSILGANALQGQNLHFNLKDNVFGFESSASTCGDFGSDETIGGRKNVMIVTPLSRGGTSSIGTGVDLGSLEMMAAVDTFDITIAYISGGAFLALLGVFLVLYHHLGAREDDGASKN